MKDISKINFEFIGNKYKSLAKKVYARDRSGLGSDSEEMKELVDFLIEFSESTLFKPNASWIFPQMLAKLADLPLTEINGLISSKALIEEIRKSDRYLGMWVVCKYPTRGYWITRQTDPAMLNYCSLVPLIMSAFKKYHGIKYSKWNRDEVSLITEAGLTNAMLETWPELTIDQTLELRQKGLTVKTGPKAGSIRSATTTYGMYINLPISTLGKMMFCQTWCAHPSNRTEYMILNPSDWDNMPEPLVDSEVIIKPSIDKRNTVIADIPWLD